LYNIYNALLRDYQSLSFIFIIFLDSAHNEFGQIGGGAGGLHDLRKYLLVVGRDAPTGCGLELMGSNSEDSRKATFEKLFVNDGFARIAHI
jgi:hypothetical protein